jgi:hypothetical protein
LVSNAVKAKGGLLVIALYSGWSISYQAGRASDVRTAPHVKEE